MSDYTRTYALEVKQGRVYRDGEQVWPQPIPEGAMRVAPGTDAVVWRVCPDYKAEL